MALVRCWPWLLYVVCRSIGHAPGTAATLLIEQGVHIRVVQEVPGYTRVTTTKRYTHVATLHMKDASERIGEAFWVRDEGNCNLGSL